ncbi:MAG: sulfotransferase [Bacteroidota bacterium]
MKVYNHVRKPEFFIIGAPRCGTTALARYLGEHPDIHLSYPKEPNYFNTDFSKKQRKFESKTLKKYFLKYFCSTDQKTLQLIKIEG